jgi:hypothetical protein
MTDEAPQIHSIRKHAGIAGQFSVSAEVQYPDEPTRTVTFVGSSYGGPVLMQSDGFETFVTSPDRFGAFGESWVRLFFERS